MLAAFPPCFILYFKYIFLAQRLAIRPLLSLKLKKRFPSNWESSIITYLGIQLTSSSSRLYSTNFPLLLTKVEEDLNQISKLHLSWLGRIAAYQMQVLPKLLYYFRTLRIPMPQTFISQLTACLRKYIWAGKKLE